MRRVCLKSLFLQVILGLLFVSLWGCATASIDESKNRPQNMPAGAQTQTAATKEVQCYIHTVKWLGESLSIIAGWYTGDIQNWEILAEANKDMDPNVVVVGQKICVPKNMMTTQNPMTKAHVDKYYRKTEKYKTRSKPAEKKKKDETPTLYGPK